MSVTRKKRIEADAGKTMLGWKEWVSLPGIGVPAVKVKIDTGARTSALHAFSLKTFEEGGRRRVRFGIHPLQRRKDIEIFCTADILDERIVCDSGGHREKRIVIRTPMCLGGRRWDVEFTLTDRDGMRFRGLLGRMALHGRFVIDAERSYLTGKAIKKDFMLSLKRKNG